MPLTRRQFIDHLAKSRPSFHKIAKGAPINEGHNVFDDAFTVHNDGGKPERSGGPGWDSMLLTPLPDEVFDFSQYMTDTAPTTGMGSDVAPSLSPAKTMDITTPGLSSFFDALTPNQVQSCAGNISFEAVDHELGSFGDYSKFPNLHVDYFTQFDEHASPFEKQELYDRTTSITGVSEQSTLNPTCPADAVDADTMQYTFIETSPADDENKANSKPPRMRYPDIPSPMSKDEPQQAKGVSVRDVAAPPKKPSRSATRRKKRPLSEADQQAKRDRFLYKNKVAAQKCRERKKSRTVELQDRFREVQMEHQALELDILQLSEEAAWLRAQMSMHLDCGFGKIVKNIDRSDESEEVREKREEREEARAHVDDTEKKHSLSGVEGGVEPDEIVEATELVSETGEAMDTADETLFTGEDAVEKQDASPQAPVWVDPLTLAAENTQKTCL